MDDLALWLNAQLDEDERIARDACGPDNHWKVAEQASCECCSNVRTARDVLVCTPDDRDAPHIAAWSPARVLREIDAKRRIVAAHERRPMSKGGQCGLRTLLGRRVAVPDAAPPRIGVRRPARLQGGVAAVAVRSRARLGG